MYTVHLPREADIVPSKRDQLTPALKKLLHFVRDFQQDEGRAPRLDEIASGLKLPESTVTKRVEKLMSLGLVRRRSEPMSDDEAALWRMVDAGKARWPGGQPHGSRHPAKLTPGPPISDYIIQEREALRGPYRA
jgi:hypothetical protein